MHMTELQARSFDGEVAQTFAHGQAVMATVGGSTLRRHTFEPGWRWSESLKEMAGTDSCQTHHIGYAISGHLHVKTDDGAEQDIRAGDAYNIPPGHDGWVIGDETFLSVEFAGTT